jgi:hypothetical protein
VVVSFMCVPKGRPVANCSSGVRTHGHVHGRGRLGEKPSGGIAAAPETGASVEGTRLLVEKPQPSAALAVRSSRRSSAFLQQAQLPAAVNMNCWVARADRGGAT